MKIEIKWVDVETGEEFHSHVVNGLDQAGLSSWGAQGYLALMHAWKDAQRHGRGTLKTKLSSDNGDNIG